jgi:hypothetical protein
VVSVHTGVLITICQAGNVVVQLAAAMQHLPLKYAVSNPADAMWLCRHILAIQP